MFKLVDQQAKISSFNPRAELNGEDPKPAADIKFEVNLASDMLAHFHPTLRAMLFHKAGAQDLANESADAPNLRFPKLGTLKYDQEIVGAELAIAYGIGGPSDIKITGVTVNGFTLDPQEGGTVIVGFRCQFHPNESQAGKLCLLVQKTVEVTLTPPAEADDAVSTGADSKPLNTAGDAAQKRGRGKSRTAELV